MKNVVRFLLLTVALSGFGVAGASDSAASGGWSHCFSEPSVYTGVPGLVADLSWRASCVWNSLVTM